MIYSMLTLQIRQLRRKKRNVRINQHNKPTIQTDEEGGQ